MNLLFHKGRFYEVPSEWNELGARQLLRIMQVLHSDADMDRGRLQLLLILLNWSRWKLARVCGMHRFANLSRVIKWKFIPSIFGRYLDNTERMASSCNELTEFLFKKNTLTVNLLPKYRGLYGPASKLANFRMGEFAFAEYYFFNWKQSGTAADLNNLVAVLYRKPKTKKDFNDMRAPFDQAAHEKTVKLINNWPMPAKLAIAEWYHGCREEKINRNKSVFEYQPNPEDETESLHGLWSVMRSVAKAGHFGDFDKVADQYVDTILMELHESIVEYEREKDRIEKLKANSNA